MKIKLVRIVYFDSPVRCYLCDKSSVPLYVGNDMIYRCYECGVYCYDWEYNLYIPIMEYTIRKDITDLEYAHHYYDCSTSNDVRRELEEYIFMKKL